MTWEGEARSAPLPSSPAASGTKGQRTCVAPHSVLALGKYFIFSERLHCFETGKETGSPIKVSTAVRCGWRDACSGSQRSGGWGAGVAAREKVPETAEGCVRTQRSALGIRTHPKRSPSLFNYKSRENTNCIKCAIFRSTENSVFQHTTKLPMQTCANCFLCLTLHLNPSIFSPQGVCIIKTFMLYFLLKKLNLLFWTNKYLQS